MTLRRTPHDRFLGGVLGGIAKALHASPPLVRLIFIVLLLSRVWALALGALILYGLAWMFLPEEKDPLTARPLLVRRPSSSGLTRSRQERRLAGVCGGLAAYYRLDPLPIRLGFAAFALLTLGWGSVLYAVAALLIPQETL